jgi:hypothetical protein
MAGDRKPPDTDFYRRKAAEYRAKAKETGDARLSAALEAVAREYEQRAVAAGGESDKPQK